MGGGAAEARASPTPGFKYKPKHLTLNPNWAQLQQQLKSRGRPRTPTALPELNAAMPASASALGKRKARPDSDPKVPPESILTPTSDDFGLTDALAMDCEMVGVSPQGNRSALGRVTLVNMWGNVVYDEYVRPVERIVDFRTKISGIHPKDMKKAKEFHVVQKKVAELIKGRILVGHALHNDLKVLLLSHPKKDIRDTSEYQPLLRDGRRRALKDLAAEILGIRIQQQEHCPIEDARTVMLIYKKYRKDWEKCVKEQLRFKKKLKNRRVKKSTVKNAFEPDVLTAS